MRSYSHVFAGQIIESAPWVFYHQVIVKGGAVLSILIGLILVSYLVVGAASYRYLYKIRLLIGYHFGMNIAMTSGMVMGITIGTALGYEFPASYTLITVITTLIAMIIGAIFGALVDYQILLTGATSGIMGGIMGPMIGMAADLHLIIFCTFLVFISFGLLCLSARA